MKIIVLFVFLLAMIVVGGIFIFQGSNSFLLKETAETTESDYITLLKDTEVLVPDSQELVTLKNGNASFKVEPDSALEGSIVLLDDVFAVWEQEDRTDLITVFAVNTGGTGQFYFLVLFDVTHGGFTKKSEILLGDRIEVVRLGIGELVHDADAEYRVSVNILDRAVGEPFSANPTTPKTKTFYVVDQDLEEVEVVGDDS